MFWTAFGSETARDAGGLVAGPREVVRGTDEEEPMTVDPMNVDPGHVDPGHVDPAVNSVREPRTGSAPARTGMPALRRREVLLAAGLLLAFAPALQAMAAEWNGREEMSHGALVPLVSLWVVLRDRRRLARIPIVSDPRGLIALAAGIALYAVGSGAGLAFPQGLAFVIAVVGAVWWLRGPGWLRGLAFPLAFLCFMVPVPVEWLAPVVIRLRLLVTSGAVELMHAFAVPVTREGNVLLLPGGVALFVADACSGVTSLLTLTPLAVLLAALTQRTLMRRFLLVASVVPIALGGNLLRVLATVYAARRFGVEAATEGGAHASVGLLAVLLGCAALLAVSAALRRPGSAP